MILYSFFKRFLFGIHFEKEYLCVARESFQQPFKVNWLDGNHSFIEEVSNHRLLGYKPVLICLNTTRSIAPANGFLSFTHNGNEIACLQIERVNVIPDEFSSFLYRC